MVAVCLLAGCKDRPAISTAPDAAEPGVSQALPAPDPLSEPPLKYRPQQKRVPAEPK